MDYYVRISASLLHATVWQQPKHVRLVWVTMLLAADEQGCVESSLSGLASLAGVTVDECFEALQVFASPDAHSRTREHEGRRVEAFEGGWRILNHSKYRQRQTAKQQASAARQREYARRREEAIQRELSGGGPGAAGEASFYPPADYTPGARQVSRAAALGLNIGEVVARFIVTRSPTPRVNWSHAFRAFLTNYAQEHATAQPPAIRVDRVSADIDLTRTNAEGDQVLGPRRVIVPDDWAPTEAHEARAQELGLDFSRELEAFRLYEFGKPVADWNRRFARWLVEARNRRETERARERQRAISGGGGPVRARLQPDHGVTGFERLEGSR